jgi:hypothetical protein
MQKGKPPRRSRMISSRIIATACGAVLLIIDSAMGTQVSNRVITWGENTPEWNCVLRFGGLKSWCANPLSSCADYT